MGWKWNETAGRYYDTDTGRFLSRTQALEYVDASIAATESAVDTLAGYVADDMLSPGDWRLLMREEVKREYLREYMLGKGGRAQMTQADYGSIGGMLKEQYAYLDAFAEQVGEMSEAAIRSRSRMYIRSAREAYERAKGRVAQAAGFDEEIWVLGVAEHCDDCVALSAEGWQPIGYYPAPGAGDTQCLCITTPSSLVLTKDGLCPLGNVQVGDLVLTHKLRWRPVTALVRKPSQDYHRQAWIRMPHGQWVGCTHDHLWFTDNGWLGACDIDTCNISVYTAPINMTGRYTDGKADMREVRQAIAPLGKDIGMPVMPRGVRLWGKEGPESCTVYELCYEPEGQGTMGRSCHCQENAWGDCEGWKEKAYSPTGVGQFGLASQRRWSPLELVLARGRESQEDHLSLSMGVDNGSWANTQGICHPPYQWRSYRRPTGESGADDQASTCKIAWGRGDGKQQSANLDMPELREELSDVSTKWQAPEILLQAMLRAGTTLYDITVEEDHSFWIEGLFAHNTNCACHKEYRKSTTEEVWEG